ncbi:MAG: hypothetical protein GY749_28750 [Desulfobacteraceae bacterium]|nr:hypothetical protein [Desulfobacteraceae bacterium]
MSEEPKDKFKETSFLIDVGTVITLLVAMFYTAGWSVAYHYFDKFHLGLIGLNIPKEYLFMYSFQAVRDQLFFSFLALLSGVVLYFLVKVCFQGARNAMGKETSEQEDINTNIFRKIFKNRQYELFLGAGLLLTPVMIFLLFWQFYNLGTFGASALYETQALNDFESYPRVKVFLKEPDKFKEKAGEWEKGCYKLLLRNKDHLYVFKPEIYRKGNPRNISATDIIPQGDVKAVRVLPLYNKCAE